MSGLSRSITVLQTMYDADFLEFEELHKAGAGDELAKRVGFPPVDRPYNVRRWKKSGDINHDVFGPNCTDDSCYLP